MTATDNKLNLTPEEAGNQRHWDEIAPVHSKHYDMEAIAAGKSTLDDIQIQDLGDLNKKSLLHLQCHIGNDTLSLARLGAKVSGVDFSQLSLKLAQDLFEKAGLPGQFYYSDVLSVKENVPGLFDVVYTSQGVLCWVRDLSLWAENIRAKLKPGGFFYLMETHPFAMMLDVENPGLPALRYPYFASEKALVWPGGPDYADNSYHVQNPSYEWQWSLSDILNALLNVGLKIDFLNEYPMLFWKLHPELIQDEKGWWHTPAHWPPMPLTFTLKATLSK
jgi:SAM-dependent methyltransferase